LYHEMQQPSVEPPKSVGCSLQSSRPLCCTILWRVWQVLRMMIFERLNHFFGALLTFVERIGGLLPAPAIVLLVWINRYRARRSGGNYNLEPQGRAGAFEPLLQKYLRLAELIISLATGSIVLLIGSSFLHGRDGRLPPYYAPPLLVLATSVLTAVFLWWPSFWVTKMCSVETRTHPKPMHLTRPWDSARWCSPQPDRATARLSRNRTDGAWAGLGSR